MYKTKKQKNKTNKTKIEQNKNVASVQKVFCGLRGKIAMSTAIPVVAKHRARRSVDKMSITTAAYT